MAIGQWLARLDSDAPHVQFTELFDRNTHMILFTDRDASTGDHEICPGRGIQHRLPGRIQGIPNQTQVDDFTVHGFEQATQGITVRIVYLAHCQRLTRLNKLVTGKENTDLDRFIDREGLQADRGRKPYVLGPEATTPLQYGSAASYIVTRGPDVIADRRS